MFSHIVVPLDESEYSERALTYAEQLAALTDADISIVTALTHLGTVEAPGLERLDAIARERAELYLHRRGDRVREAGSRVARAEARFGEPATVITAFAREVGADLVVMSTHGLGAARRYALGSVAMKVLTTAPCPVLMVRITEQGCA